MFYRPAENDHGLPHDPFKALIVPRPIGWISSKSLEGHVNLAPYSFFNAVAGEPPVVMYSSNGTQPHGPKDTITNIEQTGEFVVHVATWDLRDQMNISCVSALPDVNEMELAGLTPVPCEIVDVPRIKEAPVAMECRYLQTVELPCNNPKSRNAMVLGEVVGVHIDPVILTNGRVDLAKLRPIARLGYMDYAVISETFEMLRPKLGR